MLPAQNRLKSKRDFDRIYKSGKTLNTAFFRIKTAPNELKQSRFGIVIPNKIIKTAVVRNQKKRQVRAALQNLVPKLIPGYDVALVAKTELVEAEFNAIYDDMEEGFKKISFIKEVIK